MAAIMNCTQPAALIHLPLGWTGTQPGPCSSLVPIPRSGQSACGIRVLGLAEWKKKGRIRCSDRPGNAAELEAISGEAQFEEVLLEAQRTDTTIVIEWMAKWCRKCIYLKPQLEKLAMEFQQGAKFYFVDVNAVPQALVKRAGVTKMPTIQLWKNKEKKGEIIAGHKVWLVVDEVREMVRASQGLDVAI